MIVSCNLVPLAQKTKDGKRFTEVLSSRGIFPGVKGDTGTVTIQDSEKNRNRDYPGLLFLKTASRGRIRKILYRRLYV